ncbi:Uncharacterised protein [Bordetella pertussis]|nr:Uncharacterised protein [Bordetella pertussis]
MAGAAARLDEGAQAGQPGAVADQDQRAGVGRRMEVAIGAHSQVDGLAGLRGVRQPAAAQAQRAVGGAHLAHQQVHCAIGRQRGNRIFAMGMQRAVGRIARADLGNVAGLPLRRRAVRRRQFDEVARRALAAGVEQGAPRQPPGLVGGGLPVRQVGAAGYHAQVVLPVAQRRRVAGVDFDQVEQRRGAVGAQPVVQAMAEAAEVRVAAVAQREHGVAQGAQPGAGLHGGVGERGGRVGRIAFAVGADDEQRTRIVAERGGVDLPELGHARLQAAAG